MKADSRLLTELSVDPFLLDDVLRNPNPRVEHARAGGEKPVEWARCEFFIHPGDDPGDPDSPPPSE